MNNYQYFNRDISWLSFNERVLLEAANETVPLLERIKFLSIYSSNLDEFYRVRMPAIQKNQAKDPNTGIYQQATDIVDSQQRRFGETLRESIIPQLKTLGINFYYDDPIPQNLASNIMEYFYCQVAGLLQPFFLKEGTSFFAENNMLYIVVVIDSDLEGEQLAVVNVPTNHLDRFVNVHVNEVDHIIYLDDIIKQNLKSLFPMATSIASYNIKINRDAELDLLDDDGDDMTEILERQLRKRKYGFPTRFLFEPGLPSRHLPNLIEALDLKQASIVQGGKFHNSKDLASLPIKNRSISYLEWPPIRRIDKVNQNTTLFESIVSQDLMVHAPYQTYDTILRFFNEAAIDPSVEQIYTTMYRVAHDSKIALALISAAKNGKKVVVLVELKARFDEANNIRWSKKMKAAGVKIVHSINSIKVHAKLALVQRKHEQFPLLGLLATGNLNEGTAQFYTDHILLTAHQPMLKETKRLFRFLSKNKRQELKNKISFEHLLVAQFNLHSKFLHLLDREIAHAKSGLASGVTIKLNNLEEQVLIDKLYEASNVGVKINLIVRSICRLVPGVPGQSENIKLRRIVDRFLEHGRIFIFCNNENYEVYMGSADWMNRNIYKRIEVSFPIYSEKLKNELIQIIALQWEDTMQAVVIDALLNNIFMDSATDGMRSQEAIYKLLSEKN